MSNSTTVQKLQVAIPPSTAAATANVAKPTVAPKFNFGAVVSPTLQANLSADTFSKALPKATEETAKYPSVAAAVASMTQDTKPANNSQFAGKFLAFAGNAKSDSGLSKDEFIQGFGSDAGGSGGGGSQQFS